MTLPLQEQREQKEEKWLIDKRTASDIYKPYEFLPFNPLVLTKPPAHNLRDT